MKNRVDKTLDGIKGELFKLALDIHDNPEMGLVEYKAAAWQKALLEKYGFEVEMPFCGMDTAFKATYRGKKPGPNIAYIAEYDALEGLGHACGHNLMAMIGCGAGIALREFADEYGGNVFVFGTPAEETSGGKVPMVEAGVFKEMDAAMTSHAATDYVSGGTSTAISGYRFEFFGRASSPANHPEYGINALDAVVNTFNMINALRQHKQDTARIHGIITKAGDAANIVPEYACMLIEIRSPDSAYQQELCEKVVRCAKGAALGTGTRLEISHHMNHFDTLLTNETLSKLHDELLRSLGITDIKPPRKPAASTDMGNISHQCPVLHPSFGITGGRMVAWHTHECTEATGTQEALDNALISAKALALTGATLLKEPERIAGIRKEFEERTGAK